MATIYLVVAQMGPGGSAPVKAFASRDMANATREDLSERYGGSSSTSRSYLVIPVTMIGATREQSIVALILLLGLFALAITAIYRLATGVSMIGDVIALAFAIFVVCYWAANYLYRRKHDHAE